jgi:hypothetical protein
LKPVPSRYFSDFLADLLKPRLHKHFSNFSHYFPTGLISGLREFNSIGAGERGIENAELPEGFHVAFKGD